LRKGEAGCGAIILGPAPLDLSYKVPRFQKGQRTRTPGEGPAIIQPEACHQLLAGE